MRSLGILPIRNLDDIQQSCRTVDKEIDAVPDNDLSAQNVDLINAVSNVLDACPGILEFHDYASKMFDFPISSLDKLKLYAEAALYLHLTNLPKDAAPPGTEEKVAPLRSKLLMWALPLAGANIFSQAAIDRIKEGAGLKDAAADLIALSSLYENDWEKVKGICAVTTEELEDARKLGLAVFTAMSRRETEGSGLVSNNLRVRKAFTLLDRAYTQCRRMITYARYLEGDYETIAPSLRRNIGTPHSSTTDKPESTEPVVAQPATPTGPVLGGGGSPFIKP